MYDDVSIAAASADVQLDKVPQHKTAVSNYIEIYCIFTKRTYFRVSRQIFFIRTYCSVSRQIFFIKMRVVAKQSTMGLVKERLL